MKVPLESFVSGIAEKKIYYFSTTEINSPSPHHFICIKRTDDDILVMSCCTSQFSTVKNFVESRKLPNETLVWIAPDKNDHNNPFTKDTYVNCNDSFTFTVDEFRERYSNDSVNLSGELSDLHYEQVLIGLHKSPMIDQETKDLIPKPEDV